MGYAHPCALVNQRVVDKLKSSSIRNSEPWKSVISSLAAATPLDYKPQPIANVNIGEYGKGIGHKEFTKDAEQAVQQAVMWCATQNPAYAKNAIAIMEAWTNTCKTFDGSNAPLELGWGGCSLVRAAEILRHTYPQWSAANTETVNRFIDTLMMPKLRTRLGWTNNWQTTICEARLQVAIFRDDNAELEWAITEYKRIFREYVSASGQTGETLRDLVHAQFGIGGLLQIPELVYEYTNGTINLFGQFSKQLAAVCELHAALLLGRIPPNCGIQKEAVKEPWFIPCGWEIAITRLGAKMPNTEELLKRHRPEKYVFHWGLGTLTHFCCG